MAKKIYVIEIYFIFIHIVFYLVLYIYQYKFSFFFFNFIIYLYRVTQESMASLSISKTWSSVKHKLVFVRNSPNSLFIEPCRGIFSYIYLKITSWKRTNKNQLRYHSGKPQCCAKFVTCSQFKNLSLLKCDDFAIHSCIYTYTYIFKCDNLWRICCRIRHF